MCYTIVSLNNERGYHVTELDTNAHSVFLLYYHLVLVVKYRRKVIDEAISARAREIFEYIAPTYKISAGEWNHGEDHVHVLFRAHPKSEISKFINAYKSASSRLIKKEYPSVREKLWGEYFWSQSFCLLTTGGAPIDVIKSYIENQGEKDEKKKIQKSRHTQQGVQIPDIPYGGAGDTVR